MRIVVHDFSGHPFQVQLSRELARRGHETLHLHCPSYVSGKGALTVSRNDPPSFSISGVALDQPFEKYSPVSRYLHERMYGIRAAVRIDAFNPDVVLSSNTPLFSQRLILRASRRASRKFVFWQQDIYSLGMQSAVAKIPLFGRRLGSFATALEGRLLADSDTVIVISEDFAPTLMGWGIDLEKVHVIHNWAPIAELPEVPRDNSWSREHGLTDKLVFLYSGTLGRKHNPAVLLQLALRLRNRPEVRVVVASEGESSEWLRRRAAAENLGNLVVLGFQPYERLPEVLGTGDVLLVMLEEDAGVFAVPSKMLSYQCAGRALLAYVPSENLSSRIIETSQSGIAVPSGDQDGYIDAAEHLASDHELRRQFGVNARRYAEATFDIRIIGDRFERILADVVGGT
jgi:glycosyltransferase involved in cell wall biosynthesis